jgi:polygalacturonase
LVGSPAAGADEFASQPGRFFDVTRFGAKGDGHTIDTAAINRAIDAAAGAGGGTVYFPSGDYLSVSIHLKSNVGLYLDHGATIVAAEPSDAATYDPPEPNASNQYQDFGHTHWHNSLIWGENLHDVSIAGPGMIWGKGLSRGWGDRNKPAKDQRTGEFGYPNPRDTLDAGVGNKAIALKLCRNVILRDVTIKHGGHFAILATGVDNFTCDNLKIDTNRDGIDFDSCQNVRVSNCTVNSPYDDGICPKSSFALGYARPTQNVTITNCQVSGYDEGTVLDGTYKLEDTNAPRIGRIKFGTESNGGFKNITISNCVFDHCRGLALETVDGGFLEDVTIDNITMRDILNSPIFLRLGARLRGPDGTKVGALRRVTISNVVCSNADSKLSSIISGVPGHDIEDVVLHDVRVWAKGGGTEQWAKAQPAEKESGYPEPGMFGPMPAHGLFARHVRGLELRNVEFHVQSDDARPAIVLEHAADVELDHVKPQHSGDAPAMVTRDVKGLETEHVEGVPDQR